MNKKLVVVLGVTLAAGALFARPHGGPRGPVMHARVPMHHHHHHSAWGRGGSHFWPGFVGGVVGGVVARSIVTPTVVTTTPVVYTTPTVVTTTPVVAAPVYTTQQVWVQGAYIDQVQPNGTIVRVWQPGHYETRSVLVQ